MAEEERVDVVVAGAGPAGLSAAYVLAKEGLDVLVIERGDFPGSKNVMGGVLYRHPTEAVFPDLCQDAPLERHLIEQQLWFTTPKAAVKLTHRNSRFDQPPFNSFTVLRAQFDRWMGKKVEEVGAFLVPETVAEELIIKEGKVQGVSTGREEGDVLADYTVVADGANSLLLRQAGLAPPIPTSHVALAVKEVLLLPKDALEARFGLMGEQGVAIEIFGESTRGLVGTGFVYTNRETLSVGVGALLSDLAAHQLNPNDLLEGLKEHPAVRPLLEGAEVLEYQAHLIPEGGAGAVPKLFGDGYVAVGDAAMLVNSVHREGANLAVTSGRLAAETILEARRSGKAGPEALSGYEAKLKDSYVLKDLEKYKDVGSFLQSHRDFLTLYPRLANEIATGWLEVDGRPKRDKQQELLGRVRESRSVWSLVRDMYSAWRAFR